MAKSARLTNCEWEKLQAAISYGLKTMQK